MSVFLVALQKENEEVSAKIKELYPNSYTISNTLFLVSDNTITRDLANWVGVRDNHKENGVVFKLEGSYAGRFTPHLWEWLKKEEEQGNL